MRLMTEPARPRTAVMDVIFPVPNDSCAQSVGAQFFQASWRLVVQPQASVAEKWSSTNRIRSQFARIKAAEWLRYQLRALRKTRLYGSKSPTFHGAEVRTSRKRKSGHFEDESQETSGL